MLNIDITGPQCKLVLYKYMLSCLNKGNYYYYISENVVSGKSAITMQWYILIVTLVNLNFGV